MALRYTPLAVTGDTVRFVAATDDGREIARFDARDRELAKAVRGEWDHHFPKPYFWLGAEAEGV